MIKNLLRFEYLFLFLASLYFYALLQGNWILFILLLFVPDISMVGYLKDAKVGSYVYNSVHNYLFSVIIILIGGIILQDPLIIQIGIILFAHVSMDRFLAYGLKEESSFKNTHLGRIGK